MNECLYCSKPVKNKYCNVSCQNRLRNPLRKKERIIITKKCPKCEEHFELEIIKDGSKKNERKFCSRKCANSKIWSEEDKLKKSIAAKKSNKVKKNGKSNKNGKNLNCINCGNSYYRSLSYVKGSKYCSHSCSTLFKFNQKQEDLKMKNCLLKNVLIILIKF